MRARVLALVTIILGLGCGSLSAQWWGVKPRPSFHRADNDDKCGHDRDHDRGRDWRGHDRHDDDQCCDDDRRGHDRWGRGHDKDDDNCGDGGDSGTGGGATGSISGNVTGSNGAMAGWTIYLISSSNTTSTTTGTNGSYSFANLAAGTYTVCEANPSPDAEQLPANGSSSTAAPCSTGASYGFTITLAAGAASSGNNFVNGAGGIAF